ncbi:MAG TPA: class I SAM-dependent methyltransferase, partial [Ktedonobacteraceae bacterium]|nr:class I SAM-dependent methyltransferase [Ktedonobacteraceae bacterium]
RWSEADSQKFLSHSEIFVPGRAEQIASLLHLIPARTEETFTVVELAAGGGVLARAILERFPFCQYVALDGSTVMRDQLSHTLSEFGKRVEVRPFELEEQEWRTALPTPLRCVLSSLAVHHLSDQGKRQLFQDMFTRLEPGGALLLADIVKPATPRIAELYARQYDEIVRSQSLAAYGDLRGYESFQELKWNYFIHDYADPDSYDLPSLLSDQLLWFREAGFRMVDCFWMQAGHAVYGGNK